MKDDPFQFPSDVLAGIQPIVLVGGRSRRFGRDKLREPLADSGELLVQRSIAALREVFGDRVKLVGECHQSLLELADGVIPDQLPGVGPIGGILSALRAADGPVFVLAGDMPAIAPKHIWRILRLADDNRSAWAVLAATDRIHPCVGLYRPETAASLEYALAHRHGRLSDAIASERRISCPLPVSALRNVNEPGDLES